MAAPAAMVQVNDEIEELLTRQTELRERRDRLRRLVETEARAPRADWAGASFPWDAEAAGLLADVFGLQSFRRAAMFARSP